MTHDLYLDVKSRASCGHDLLSCKSSNKVNSQLIAKVEWKQTDVQMDGGDCITSLANAVVNYFLGYWGQRKVLISISVAFSHVPVHVNAVSSWIQDKCIMWIAHLPPSVLPLSQLLYKENEYIIDVVMWYSLPVCALHSVLTVL